MKDKIKVLVVDDSALIRNLLTEIINSDPDLEVVGVAEDPYFARDKIKKLKPDVLTLDIEMPRMDGITFLKNLMRLHPLPVLMISTLTEAGADVTLDALEIGAIDFISKPKADVSNQLKDYAEDIISKVRACAATKGKISQLADKKSKPQKDLTSLSVESLSADTVIAKKQTFSNLPGDKLIALGASTGGTEAIKEVLSRLPENIPAMVISQHIPEAFSGPFAKRMNDCSASTVHEAEDGQEILPGNVYISPGSHHLIVEKTPRGYRCKLSDGSKVNRHRPSVDVMFRSVAQTAGKNAVGVMLTGMGDDGAECMKEMHDVGCPTIAQDEQSSVVWGMPGAAVKADAVDYVLPLTDIPDKILNLLKQMK